MFGCSHPINLAEGFNIVDVCTNLIHMHLLGSANTLKSTSVAEIHCKILTNVCAQQNDFLFMKTNKKSYDYNLQFCESLLYISTNTARMNAN